MLIFHICNLKNKDTPNRSNLDESFHTNMSWLKKEIIPNSVVPVKFSYNLQDSKIEKRMLSV
jgi:hypothetical protein